jgi:DNA (cytosine-5)-methyltransferase 1
MLGQTPASRRTSLLVNFSEKTVGRLDAPTVGEVLDGLPRIGTVEATTLAHVPWSHSRAQLARMSRVPEGGRWSGGLDHFTQTYGRLHRHGLSRTITTQFNNPGSGRFWHPTANRTITVREAARIQGFPDSFQFFPPYSRAAVLIGNALDGAVARLTSKMVKEILS